jgi:glycosyltransferase involved in cell wall biosynthesis
MRVGVVTTSYPRHEGDFAGGFVETSVRGLLEQGHSVDVIAAGDARAGSALEVAAERRPAATPGRLRIARVELPRGPGTPALFYGQGAPEALEGGGANLWFEAAAFSAALCERIRERAGAWDEIHAHWLVPSALVAQSVVGARALPVRARAHSGDVALLERIPGGRALARWLAARLTEIAFASDDLRQRFTRLAGTAIAAECRVTPAAPSPRRPSPPRDRAVGAEFRGFLRTTGIEATPLPRTILSVGRLVPIKGFDVLLKAVALHRAVTSVERVEEKAGAGGGTGPTLVILGDGPERARLSHLAARLGVDLRLPGFVPREEVSRWLTAADLYVQPSRRLANGRTEGLPVATLEALDHGLSVVASDCGGLAELPVSHPGTRVFPQGDYHALARLLA